MRLALAGIVAAAAALRFAGLGDQSYWYDEAVTVTVLDGSLGDVLSRLPDTESTPPLYYLLAWAWSQVAGLSEAGLRSLSAVAGAAAVPVAYLAARDAAGRPQGAQAGLVAAGVVAANPMLVWYSQEARAYSLVALLGALSALAVVRALDRPAAGRLALWAAASTLLLLTHYFGVFLVLAEAALLLARLPRARTPVLVACAPWLLAGLALVPLARAQEEDGRTSWIADEPLGDRVGDVLRELGTANTSLVSSSSAPPGGAYWVLAALGLAGAAVLAVRARRGGSLALVGAAALVLPLLLAVTPLDFFKDRNLIAAWPVLAIALGAALARGRTAVAAAAAVALAGVAVCVAVATDAGLQRADWESAIERIGPGDAPRAVLVQPAYAHAPLDVYGPPLVAPSPGVGVRELVVVGNEARPAQ
ncbi:MAG TPA: glycosyltransferase family 39 protein, partial [Solirubrobacteraceae bacterium]|nr:glycosyltransferase family 39 protein [Solirubrobacteraceae bacterium]